VKLKIKLMRYRSSEIWFCIIVFPAFWSTVVPSSSRVSCPLLFNYIPWRWRCHDPLNHWKSRTKWHSITSQKTWNLSNTTVKNFKSCKEEMSMVYDSAIRRRRRRNRYSWTVNQSIFHAVIILVLQKQAHD
jgi:hypothetical protein